MGAGQTERVVVNVTTRADAWPDQLSDDAVRLGYTAGRSKIRNLPSVRIDPIGHDDLLRFPGAVNVLDAWSECDPDQDCALQLEIDLTCEAATDCDGGLFAEAFLSNHAANHAPDGALTVGILPD